MKRGAGQILFLLTFLLSVVVPRVHGQDAAAEIPKDWFLKDPEMDHVQGVSTEKTYQSLLKDKPSRTVLVAVIDSGIDIDHEDLKDIVWVNEDEIPNNGIDDDKNGYIDDIHGWNFIGGKNGNVSEDTYEVTREYVRLKPKYESFDEKNINKKNKAEYDYWLKVKTDFEAKSKFDTDQYNQLSEQYQKYAEAFITFSYCDSVLQKATGKPVFKSSLSSITSTNDTINFAKNTLTEFLEPVEGDVEVREFIDQIGDYLVQLKDAVDYYKNAVEFGYNPEFNPRSIVGDNANNLNEKGYGNNDVEGPDPMHGTHVAGIIGANRKNGIGINGIADNVKIMSLRAVPNGDERDKDIANSILYAVDNGAKIINMSFGKAYSPAKEVVDKAVRYAESKGVLIIHAAGNDGSDLDTKSNYPNRNFLKGGQSKNWIEIGASSWGADENFVGSFSNYGKKSVDLFAPGVRIFSTTPNNMYQDLEGTSMACPATTGVAAILMSYFPELTAGQVKDILYQSTRKFDGLKVTRPGTKDEILFTELSATGGMVNAYEAVKLAMAMKGKPAAK
jgi:cell wall-associated protease